MDFRAYPERSVYSGIWTRRLNMKSESMLLFDRKGAKQNFSNERIYEQFFVDLLTMSHIKAEPAIAQVNY